MAKCKACGRFGLFLKLNSGLCETCFNQIFPVERMPFGLTQNMFKNPEKYIKEDEPLKRDTTAENPGFVTASDGSKIPVEILPVFFDLTGIRIIDSKLYEITAAANAEKVRQDALLLNRYLDKAKKHCRTLPDDRFVAPRLRFKFDPYAYTRDYCTLSFSPLTKTGKVAGYPIKLNIVQGEYFHAEVHYNTNGEIARAEISITKVKRYETATYTRQDCTVHTVTLAMLGGALDIRLIYRNDGGVRKKIYDSKEMK